MRERESVCSQTVETRVEAPVGGTCTSAKNSVCLYSGDQWQRRQSPKCSSSSVLHCGGPVVGRKVVMMIIRMAMLLEMLFCSLFGW